MNTTTTAPPSTCPDCDSPVNPEAFAQLRPDGPWILPAGECKKCEANSRKAAEQALRARALAHYRDRVPANYRPIIDGGSTDTAHPDWAEHRGGAQLASFNRWRRDEKPWAGIVGPGGHLKSRIIGYFARTLALNGHKLLWVNGSNLGWASDTRKDFTKRTQANEHLASYRTFPGVLILDDLWKGELNAPYIAALYALLEHRNAHRLPILWTANTHPSAMGDAIDSDNRAPIIGRLIENTHLLDLYA